MSHTFLADPAFWTFLVTLDRDLAEETRQAGCSRCGGRLHLSCYERRGRGSPTERQRRWSFCCASCRRRRRPPSVLFLGRKVYLGALVVLVSALHHGLRGDRAEQLTAHYGVSQRTLVRWRRWWLRDFAGSRFWRSAVGRLGGGVKAKRLPASLLERFVAEGEEKVRQVLRFLAPISGSEGLEALAR